LHRACGLNLWLRAAALAGLGGLAAFASVPVSTRGLEPRPDPAPDYAAALSRFKALRAKDGAAVNPLCRSRLMTHGRAGERAVVLFHGVTNCPQQFVRLGVTLHRRGANVLVPRMPCNGFLDRDTTALKRLTAEKMRDYA